MDVSPPCSSIPFHPSGASGIPREVFRRLRVSPGLRSWISFRFLERAAGAGCAPRPRDGYRRTGCSVSLGFVSDFELSPGRVLWSWSGSSGEAFGYMRDVISAMSQKLCCLFAVAVG